jgi:hypothetical protein
MTCLTKGVSITVGICLLLIAGCDSGSDNNDWYPMLAGTWIYRMDNDNETFWEQGQLTLTYEGTNMFSVVKTVTASSSGDTGQTARAGTMTFSGFEVTWVMGDGAHDPTLTGTLSDSLASMSGAWAKPNGLTGTWQTSR